MGGDLLEMLLLTTLLILNVEPYRDHVHLLRIDSYLSRLPSKLGLALHSTIKSNLLSLQNDIEREICAKLVEFVSLAGTEIGKTLFAELRV